ncbi:MAG: peptidase, partial [Hyphomonas sp.]|nr:peptidase [Hyphomonas sp.]
PPPPPPPPPPGTTWTQGQYAPASDYINKCAVVRTGVDIEGNPYPDQAGSLVQEMFWLRSWTKQTYLWENEVTDRDPNTYTDRLAYFGTQKTFAITASGENKDDFHFSQPTADYLAQRNSAPAPSYGAELAIIAAVPPRDVRIVYTEPNSPASEVDLGQPKLVRGSRILEIDGIDLVNGGNTQAELDLLNAALSPQTAGESHEFVVRDPGATDNRTITLAAANISEKPVNRFTTIDTATGPVGYILFNTFSPFASEKDIYDTITSLSGTGITDLVIDLRYNGGGLLAVSAQLGYMVAGPARTQNKTFEALRFNAAAGNSDPVQGGPNEPFPFVDVGLGFSLTENTPLPNLGLDRVYILTTGNTCSASEALVNGLRGVDVEVVLIGNTTCGKPYGFYPASNCGETYYSIQFQGVNDKGFGDYADGFAPLNSSDTFAVKAPGCAALDDLSHELGDPAENLLSTALAYRETGSCPAPVTAVTGPDAQPLALEVTRFPVPVDDPLALDAPQPSISEVNRDMTLPRHKWETGR